MRNWRGQAPLEVIIIATVLLGMLLATALIMTQRNADAGRLASIQTDTLRCQSISAVITNFNSNEGYSEASLQGLEAEMRVEKGSIVVGSISCRYSGKAQFEESDGGYVEDSVGFWLAKGKAYKAKKTAGGVSFCESSQTWC